MFQVHLTNFKTNSPEFATFAEAEAWARKTNFEATILNLEAQTNWGYEIVAFYSPISGLRDMRPKGV